MRPALVFAVVFALLPACRAAGEALPTWSAGLAVLPPAAAAARAGETIRAVVSATAPIGEVAALAAAGLPAGATFADRGDGAAWFLWTPATTQTGTHRITVMAEAAGDRAEAAWEITVLPGDAEPPGEDGADAGAKNAAPSIASAAITSAGFTRSAPLFAVAAGWADAEGAPPRYVVQWFVNGAAVSDATGMMFPAGRLARGDAVYADVHPFDGVQFGAKRRTPPITVRNAAPELLGLAYGLPPYTRATGVTAWAACVDDDGDECAYRYRWYVNGASVPVTASTLPGAFVQRGDAVAAVVTPFDGHGEGAPGYAPAVTIANAPPAGPVVRITPRGLRWDTPSLGIAVDEPAVDLDGDDVTVTYRWFKSGALFAAGTSAPAVFDQLRQGDLWVVESTPHDGFAAGTPVTAWTRVDLRRVHAIAAGREHACAVENGGQTVCWGSNAFGQLGANSGAAFGPSPTQVLNLATEAVTLATGGDHTCALDHRGGVRCWGRNDAGQTGAAGGDSFAPAPVTNFGGKAVAAAAGAKHSCALTAAGEVWCWGSNDLGQLGHLQPSSRIPKRAVLSSRATGVAAGASHTCAVVQDGSVSCWGANGDGQLGAPLSIALSHLPLAVAGVTGAVEVAAGNGHTCARDRWRRARCWGSNAKGQLGNGDASVLLSVAPLAVAGGAVYRSIRAGGAHTCAQRVDGYLACWGANEAGQLGDGALFAGATAVPAVVSAVAAASGVSAGGSHTCALTKGGAPLCWGGRDKGQTGDGAAGEPQPQPGVLSGFTRAGAVRIAAGLEHTCAVTAYGKVKCWGGGARGQLGAGVMPAEPVAHPVEVSGVTGAVDVVAGDHHTCARLASGLVRCWGANSRKQLGNGGTTDSAVPVALAGFGAVYQAVSIKAGGDFTCMLDAGNVLGCWGKSGDSWLNFGPTGYGGGVADFAAGGRHVCLYQGVAAVGRIVGIHCVGNNAYGQFGNGTRDSSATLVSTGRSCPSFRRMTAGYGHTCSDCTSALACSGLNSAGQLGVRQPAAGFYWQYALDSQGAVVPGGYSGLVAGGNQTCAYGDSMLCWGAPFLGDGAQIEAYHPVVIPLPERVVHRSASVDDAHAGLFSHSCDVSDSGTVYCWGYNRSRSLGVDSDGPVPFPVELESSAYWWE